MPFCQVSRLTTQNSGPSPAVELERRLHARACWPRAARACVRRSGRRARVGRRVPDRGVDAVDDAVDRGRARRRSDLPAPCRRRARRISCGVGGADRGDGVGRLQPGLQEADAAVVFDAVERVGARRAGRDREHARRRTGPGTRCCGWSRRWARAGRAGRVAQIGGRHRRLPVVRVQHVEALAGRRPPRQGRRRRGRARRSGASCRASPCRPHRRRARRRGRRARARRAPAAEPASSPPAAARRVEPSVRPADARPCRDERDATHAARAPGCAPTHRRTAGRPGSVDRDRRVGEPAPPAGRRADDVARSPPVVDAAAQRAAAAA